ncbi:MAG TPA: M56 family metallopeptidase [Pedobacter sp.]|nr:M56 family metallopeptidase [Pedobacter sp.]
MLSTITSFALPVLQVGFLKPTIIPVEDNYDINLMFPPPIPVEPSATNKFELYLTDINWVYVIYLLIALAFAIKLTFSVYKIIKIWVSAKKHLAGNITLVEVYDESTAFSFFNLLFIHPELAHQPAVLKHEMVHIKQKHSFDVLFFELVQVICWFNPILYFIKKDIKLLHEYIADELTTNTDMQKHEYALFLIQNSFGLKAQPITNQIFNQSILKRRINMLNKKRTASWARLRLLLALPLTGAMLCTSTMAFTKDYGYVDLLPEKSNETPIQENAKVENTKRQQPPKRDQIKFPPPVITNQFGPEYKRDKTTGKPVLSEKRYILINGKAVENLDNFYGVSNAESVKYLTKEKGIAKYGDKARFGAVEITGKNIKYFDKLTFSTLPPPPKRDQIKFPPPIVKPDPPFFKPKDQNHYYVEFRLDRKTDKPVRADHMYIVVNGTPYENQDKFYGANNTESVTILNSVEAIKKYGNKAKYRAVEITGSNITFMTKLPEPPPPRVDQIKFPPPVVKTEQKYFTPNFKKDKTTGNLIGLDKRYIVVNGNPVEDNSTFLGVTKSETITYLNPTEAVKTYGKEKGKYGAVEINGSNIYFNKQGDQLRFPPPIVKPDKPRKGLKTPPPPKVDQIKFPPPIVKPDKPRKGSKTPPPPVEPPNSEKTREVIITGDPIKN